MQDENYKSLGTLLSIVGALSFVSGILSFFNRKMLIVSNILILTGVFLVLGFQKFQLFFMNKKRLPGSIIYGLGFLFLIFKFNVIGGLLELAGFLSLFGGFLPKFLNMMQKVPYIGKYFKFTLPSYFYHNSEEDILPR